MLDFKNPAVILKVSTSTFNFIEDQKKYKERKKEAQFSDFIFEIYVRNSS